MPIICPRPQSGSTRRCLDDDDFSPGEEIPRAPAHHRLAGSPPDGADPHTSAHDAALREFGNVTLTTEAARPRLDAVVARGPGANLMSDVRYALRSPRQEPGLLAHRGGRADAGVSRPNAARSLMVKSLALTLARGRRRVGPARPARRLRRRVPRGAISSVPHPDDQPHPATATAAFSGLMGTFVRPGTNLGRGRGAR